MSNEIGHGNMTPCRGLEVAFATVYITLEDIISHESISERFTIGESKKDKHVHY